MSLRSAATAFASGLLRVFFRRIEVAGLSRFPMEGPTLVVLNHPNGLVDPVVLLGFSPRPVSFVAKAPLFDMPVVGWFARALDSIPVWRREDEGAASDRTRQTLAEAQKLLARGGVLGLFPEGTSHDDPRMKPLKSGAARIALATAAGLAREGHPPLRIVPAGLFFTDKSAFRSGVLLVFGEPLLVEPAGMEELPDAEAVRALTRRIGAALDEVTLQADRDEALSLAAWAEALLGDSSPRLHEQPLEEEFALRRRLLQGYAELKEKRPEEVARLAERIRRHEAWTGALGLDPTTLDPAALSPGRVVKAAVSTLGLALLFLPLTIPGILLHLPAYEISGRVAHRYAKGDQSLVATTRALASLLFFPATWGLVAWVVWLKAGPWAALASLVAVPWCGWLALRLSERFDDFAAALRALAALAFRKRFFLRVVAERRAIREAILRLAEEARLEGA